MKIKVDTKIYSDDCISRTVYSMCEHFFIKRELAPDGEIIDLVSKKNIIVDDEIEQIFFERLNDYKLRAIIDNKTHDIRTILYAKAFAESDDLIDDIE